MITPENQLIIIIIIIIHLGVPRGRALVCSAVLHEVATVCNNYPKHTDSNIAERAQAVLGRALQAQPPCTVKYVEDASRPGAPPQ